MSLDRIEVGRQMQKYADAITAFAIVQGVGLCLLIGQSERAACIIQKRWYWALPCVIASYIIYWIIVRACQRTEAVCLKDDMTDERLRGIEEKVGRVRVLLLALVGIGISALILGTALLPVPDCPK